MKESKSFALPFGDTPINTRHNLYFDMVTYSFDISEKHTGKILFLKNLNNSYFIVSGMRHRGIEPSDYDITTIVLPLN